MTEVLYLLTHQLDQQSQQLHNKEEEKAIMATAKQPYTCITCQVAFSSPETQRAHYKTDWHRYNLKRKVAELPSISASVFQEKVLTAQRIAEAKEKESKQSQYCKVCHKTFASANSLQSHERSRKHKETVIKADLLVNVKQKPLEMEQEDEGGDANDTGGSSDADDSTSEPLETTECLFCPNFEDDMEANLVHMSKAHGFFIPDLEYLTDLEGLIEYLGEKVGVGNFCTYCNEKGKQFYSVEAVQHHMTDKGHCKILFEGDAALEYADYYDYTKSYPSTQGVVPEDTPISDQPLKVNDDLELVLPSGVIVGHRFLKSYYKQRVPSHERKKATSVSRVMAQYRSLGWNGSCNDHGRKQRDEKWTQKMRQQKMLNVSVRGNKLQTHFRPQVVF